MNKEIDILSRSFQDLFTSKMLLFSVIPFVASTILLYILFFVAAGVGVEQLNHMILDINTTQTTIQNGVSHSENFHAQLQDSAIVQFLLHNAFTAWIASFLIYTIGSLFVLYLSIFVALVVLGFMTHMILKELWYRHYQDVEMIGYSNMFEGILLTFKWVMMMLGMYILFIPLYFVPILNIVAFNFPLYFFFHKMITYDIASNICTKEEAMLIKYRHGNRLRLKTLALYLLSLVPFVIFFASVFYVIYLGHIYFLELREQRKIK